MASKYERITDLYLQTAGEVATPEVWPRFLTTACYNFRLSFDKQVLLYAQRPESCPLKGGKAGTSGSGGGSIVAPRALPFWTATVMGRRNYFPKSVPGRCVC